MRFLFLAVGLISSGLLVLAGEPPTLVIDDPPDHAVVPPIFSIRASCSGYQGCIVRIIINGKTEIRPGTDLSAFLHQPITLTFEATDGAQQRVFSNRTVYVENNPRLLAFDEAPGEIIDFSSTRLLFRGPGRSLSILDRSTREVTPIAGDSVEYGYLTPNGAAWVRMPGSSTSAEVHEFPGGYLGKPNSTSSLKVSGRYMIWNQSSKLFLRDTVAGVTRLFTDGAGNWRNDVTDQGSVAYWGSDVFLNNTRLSTGPLRNVYPVTDGTNVVWRKQTTWPAPEEYQLAYHDGTSEKLLTAILPKEPSPGWGYRVAGGWITHVDLGANGKWQVWLLAPSGAKRRVGNLPTDCRIEGLSPTGEVIYHDDTGTRYLNEINLGHLIGTPVFRDGQWHVILGRSLFRLDTADSNPNQKPIARTDTIERAPNDDAKVSISALLANDSDPENEFLDVIGVVSPTAKGATVKISGRWIYYRHAGSEPDSFTYILADRAIATAEGTVQVNIQDPNRQASPVLSFTVDGTGAHLRFHGIPGRGYIVQSQNSPGGAWIDAGPATESTPGEYRFDDTLGNQFRLYRSVYRPL